MLRGMTAMIPGMEAYIGKSPKAFIDGGYYTKTRENRPLIGPLTSRGGIRDRRILRLWADGFVRRGRFAGGAYDQAPVASLCAGIPVRPLQ